MKIDEGFDVVVVVGVEILEWFATRRSSFPEPSFKNKREKCFMNPGDMTL
jgi:hypothetical protein